MSAPKEVAVGGIVHFWFAANTAAGSAGDGATPLYDVRKGGDAAAAIPTASGTPALLTHANYTDGLHEIAIDTTGYTTGAEYAVFCTLTISSVNPAGFVGSFIVRPLGQALWSLAEAITAGIDDIQSRLPAALTANGNMKSSLMEILTTALTETVGLLAGGFKKFFNVATPTGTANSLPDAVPGAAGGVFIAGSNAATSVTTALTANITGNVSGSVGSVTGAVGSVTGAVGSVTGAVGSVTADVGITQAGADKVWASATRTLTAFSTALALSVWDVLETAILIASSIGLKVKTNLDAAVSSRSTYAGGAVASVAGNVDGNVTGSVGSLGATAKSDVNAEVDAAIADARLDELLAADSDIDGAAPPTVGSVVHEMLSKTAGSFTFDQATDSLEAVRDKLTDIETDTAVIGAAGAGLTAVPWNAAWDAEVQSEATDALNAYDPPTKTEQDASFTEIKGATWSAVTDTLELIRDKETDIDTKTTNLPTDPADESLIIAATDAIMTRLGTPVASVSTDVAAVKSDTAAIKANTDNLPSAVKKNTVRRLHFYMVLASDHVTPATGLTVAPTRALDGALVFTAATGAVTEVASGWYFIDAAAGDLNGDTVAWKMTAATADPCCFSLLTEP